jgi:hypothetical protein
LRSARRRLGRPCAGFVPSRHPTTGDPAPSSEGDADLLKQAFNIKTVGDLGKNKFFRAAQLLAQLAEAGAK